MLEFILFLVFLLAVQALAGFVSLMEMHFEEEVRQKEEKERQERIKAQQEYQERIMTKFREIAKNE